MKKLDNDYSTDHARFGVEGLCRWNGAPYAMPELPAILGTDLAGVVEMVGAEVSGFKVGDEVYGLTGGVCGLAGTLRQGSYRHRLKTEEQEGVAFGR